jgi:FkbM family methyltransferase
MPKVRNTIRLLKWWTRQVPIVLKTRSEPRRGRWHLLSIDVPGGLDWRWELWRRIAPKEFLVDLDGGRIYFSATTINGDRGTFGEIFIRNDYFSNYRDAVVVDVGAHKGYFGAYAFLHGAGAVLSYEPEESNFAFLERAASSFRNNGHEWRTVRAAVGSHERDVELKVSQNSWSHSIVLVPEREDTGQVQKVNLVRMQDVLQEAQSFNKRIIVKIDVEGAECEVVRETPSESWVAVDELFLEMHSFAPCSRSELIAHLAMEVVRSDGLLYLVRAG